MDASRNNIMTEEQKRRARRLENRCLYLLHKDARKCVKCHGEMEEGRGAYCLKCELKITRRYYEREDAGLCTVCGKPTDGEHVLCMACHEKKTTYARAYYQANKEKWRVYNQKQRDKNAECHRQERVDRKADAENKDEEI